MGIKTEPAIGYLWTVLYQYDGGEVEVLVASAITPEIALKEAVWSLSANVFDLPDYPDFQILGIARADRCELHKTETRAPSRG